MGLVFERMERREPPHICYNIGRDWGDIVVGTAGGVGEFDEIKIRVSLVPSVFHQATDETDGSRIK